MKLRKFWDTDSEILWFTKPYTDSDKPLRFAVKLQYLDECGDDVVRDLGKYLVELSAVGPEWVTPEDKHSAAQCHGITDEDFAALSDECQCETLLSYGIRAVLWSGNGNNKGKLLREAREELQKVSILFGFYMDRPQNRIGSTGWDVISGNLLAGLERHKAANA